MSFFAWSGSLLLAFCATPQAIKCWRDGHAHGLAWSFLLMWGGGELLTFAYVIAKADYPLIFNYLFNLILIAVILYFKIYPRENSKVIL